MYKNSTSHPSKYLEVSSSELQSMRMPYISLDVCIIYVAMRQPCNKGDFCRGCAGVLLYNFLDLFFLYFLYWVLKREWKILVLKFFDMVEFLMFYVLAIYFYFHLLFCSSYLYFFFVLMGLFYLTNIWIQWMGCLIYFILGVL